MYFSLFQKYHLIKYFLSEKYLKQKKYVMEKYINMVNENEFNFEKLFNESITWSYILKIQHIKDKTICKIYRDTKPLEKNYYSFEKPELFLFDVIENYQNKIDKDLLKDIIHLSNKSLSEHLIKLKELERIFTPLVMISKGADKELTLYNQTILSLPCYYPQISSLPQKSIKKNHSCIYTCTDINHVILYLLHYLITHKYTIKKCKHCEKYFATNHFSTNYCTRNSPMKKYSQLNCALAKKRSLENISSKMKTIYNYLYLFRDEENINNFITEYKILKNKVIETPTVSAIEELEDYISRENVKRFYSKSNSN